ncbi:hypothetical protein PoB_004886500 [Plakobranchus ocellatus]|uniref:Uncharacterized protein n=1 Tax=Plakobranchus ocellatus TaxID=259542 RepID=A0AAV4BP65_9GAST|nr:hypothetical protein PoB_004886500 [Plakobranchus ocellatus]
MWQLWFLCVYAVHKKLAVRQARALVAKLQPPAEDPCGSQGELAIHCATEATQNGILRSLKTRRKLRLGGSHKSKANLLEVWMLRISKSIVIDNRGRSGSSGSLPLSDSNCASVITGPESGRPEDVQNG